MNELRFAYTVAQVAQGQIQGSGPVAEQFDLIPLPRFGHPRRVGLSRHFHPRHTPAWLSVGVEPQAAVFDLPGPAQVLGRVRALTAGLT